MKEKILYLIVGILIGAIITAACFLLLEKNKQSNMSERMPDFEQMDKGGRRQNFDNMNNGERPELPEDLNENNIQSEPNSSEVENSTTNIENRKKQKNTNIENVAIDENSTSTNESI